MAAMGWGFKVLWRSLLVAAAVVVLVACETIGYYGQAAQGQMSLLFNRESIQELINEDSVSPEVRNKLTAVLEIRKFADDVLFLPVGDAYLSYVDLDREHVVWNVFAAPEFSIDPLNWCYPIAGCVSYRGYFSEDRATKFATKLEDEGYDVYTGGVDAYSTLGWFEDPLLSTVINRSEHQLAGLTY